jgi:hypothetical protein
MRTPVAAAFAIAFGLVILISFFIPVGSGMVGLDNLLALRTIIVDWAVILAGFATLVAVIGLLKVHWRKLRARRSPDHYSAFMLLGFLVTFILGVMAYGFGGNVIRFQQTVNAIQVPVEASLMAVLAVTLTLAGFRLLQNRSGLLPVVFVLSVLTFLLLNSGILSSFQGIPMIGELLAGLQFLPIAGGRGILLGIGLGSLMTGLRILVGADRPYSG